MKRIVSLSMAVLMLVLIFAGCSGDEPAEDVTTIVACDNGWDSQKLHNEIARIVIESAYENYDFEISTASSTMNWQAMLQGDVTVDIESWTDNVTSYPDDIANGLIVRAGDVVPDSRQGFYVPRYVIEGDAERGIEPMAPDLKTVADLINYPELFPDDEEEGMGRIYGGIPGWMIDEIMHAKYLHYGLDEKFTYVRLGSEGTLFASLASAYNLGEGWVGYCYEPTVITGQLDVVLLEDEPYDPNNTDAYFAGQTEIPAQKLGTVVNKEFADANPEIIEFFSKYVTGSELISEALAHMDESGSDHVETAEWFLTENDELLDQWLSAEKATMVREALAA